MEEGAKEQDVARSIGIIESSNDRSLQSSVSATCSMS